MKHLPVTLVSIALLATSALAQVRDAVFTMPAGDHQLHELAGLSAQIRRRPLQCDVAGLSKQVGLTVTLQTELQLDAKAHQEVVAALLRDRGLLLVAGERFDRVVTVRSQCDAQASIARTPEQVLANPTQLEWVTTSIPATADSLTHIHALRPYFRNDPPGLSVHNINGQVEFTGMSYQVGFALRMMQMFAGSTPADVAQPVWHGEGQVTWPGGRMTLRTFVGVFTSTLDANLLHANAAGAVDHKTIDLGDAASMTRSEWFAEATRVLANHDCAMVCRHPGARLFALRSIQDPSYRDANVRANYVPSHEVEQYASAGVIMTTVDLQQLRSFDGFMVLRGAIAENRATTICSLDHNTLVLCGPSHQVAHHVDLLLQADSH